MNSLSITQELGPRYGDNLTLYLAELRNAPVTANLVSYAESIIDVYERRQAEAAAERLLLATHNPQSDIHEVKAAVAGSLLRGFATQDVVSAADLQDADIAEIADWAANPVGEHEVRGMATGLHDLDQILDGFWPGLYIFAGRPSMGKTAIAVRMAAGLMRSAPVLYCTFENTARHIRRRFVCAESGLSYREVKRGLQADQIDRYRHTSAQLSTYPLYFYAGARSLAHVTAAIHREYHRHGRLGAVILDNLGHITTGEEMYQERGTVCKAMLEIAQRLGIAVIALHHINRAVESLSNKRPSMGMLRDSGQIEQDADVVALLYRDEYYNHDTESPNILEVGVTKNRNDGGTGSVELFSNKHTGGVANATRIR